MQQFTDLIKEWQTFYATLALACATLIGLLFIAMTVNPETLKNRTNAWQLRIARKTFGDFLLVLMTSLMFLVPGLPPLGLASALFALGIAWSFGVIGRLLVTTMRERRQVFSLGKQIRVFYLSLLGGIDLIL
jgi:hypothetical protein